jgi:hypothetical protein
VSELAPLAAPARDALLARVRERQQKVSFRDYESWIRAARPPEFV